MELQSGGKIWDLQLNPDVTEIILHWY